MLGSLKTSLKAAGASSGKAQSKGTELLIMNYEVEGLSAYKDVEKGQITLDL